MRHDNGPDRSRERDLRPVQSVTSAPQSAAEEQRKRMRRYLLTMGIRVICGALALVASGWLRWTFVTGAVVLPYIAVVMANAVGPRVGDAPAPVDHQPDDLHALSYAPDSDPSRVIHGDLVDDEGPSAAAS